MWWSKSQLKKKTFHLLVNQNIIYHLALICFGPLAGLLIAALSCHLLTEHISVKGTGTWHRKWSNLKGLGQKMVRCHLKPKDTATVILVGKSSYGGEGGIFMHIGLVRCRWFLKLKNIYHFLAKFLSIPNILLGVSMRISIENAYKYSNSLHCCKERGGVLSLPLVQCMPKLRAGQATFGN